MYENRVGKKMVKLNSLIFVSIYNFYLDLKLIIKSNLSNTVLCK